MKPITTTLNAIIRHAPCKDGWKKLLRYLGKTEADDEPLALTTVLESNGLDHAVWCLRALPESEQWRVRLFAVACAEQVKHLMTDERSLNALRVAEAYALGFATINELCAAEEEAWDAAWDATLDADKDAASGDAAWYAAWYVDYEAAFWAARAAWAARVADRDSARYKQETLFKAYFGSPLPKAHYIEQYTK